MGIFNIFNGNKDEQVKELVELAKEVSLEMLDLTDNLRSNNNIVSESIRSQMLAIGNKLNRAYDLKKNIGSQTDTIVFFNGYSDVRIPSFFFSQKMTATVIEQDTGVRFNLKF